LNPCAQVLALKFPDRPVDDHRCPPLVHVIGPVLGRIDSGAEWERALDRVAGALVINVVKNQSIEVEMAEPFDGRIRDLREPLGWRGPSGRSDSEEYEASFAGADTSG
ncbi:MAG: hypothetical protein QOE58_3109, partial [Actinomycetota bacterium]|nr:hypothetical protein [Actinomycetota bacterium]